MSLHHPKWIFTVCVCLFAILAGCSREPSKDIDQVTIQLKWVHQAQFAGFYSAIENGYFADENIEVTLLEGGKNVSQTSVLLTGQADFSIIPAESLLTDNDASQKIVGISVLFQHSPLVFAARTGSGIIRPKDFAGKTIALKGLEHGGFRDALVLFTTLMQKQGVDTSTITKVPYDYQYSEFVAGKADIIPSYLIGGIPKLRSKGYKLNLIWPGDYGISFYADTIATTDRMIQEKPDLVLRFLRASLKGWQYVAGNPDEAITATLKYAKVKPREIQQSMMDAELPLIRTGTVPIGWMEEKIWVSMYHIMKEQGFTRLPVGEIDSIYTMKFLDEIYPEEKQ